MTGIARLPARDVPMVKTTESDAGPQPDAEDALLRSDEAFASILAGAGGGLPRSPAPFHTGSRAVSVHFHGGMRLAAAPVENQPDAEPLQEKGTSSPRADEPSPEDVAATGLARSEAKPNGSRNASPEETGLDGLDVPRGQRPILDTLGTEDSEVDQAPDDREMETAAAGDRPAGAAVGLYIRGPALLELPSPEASAETSGTEASPVLADSPAEQGAPTLNASVSKAPLRTHGAGFEAMRQVASANTPTDRTARSGEIPDAAVPADASGLAPPDAVDPLPHSTTPASRVRMAPRMEPGRIGTEQRPAPAIEAMPDPESASVAAGGPATALPVRLVVIGRETAFAPARPVVLEPFTAKGASAETGSQIKSSAAGLVGPAQASLTPPSRDRQPAPGVPLVDPPVVADDNPRSSRAREDRTVAAPSAGDGRIAPTPAASENATPPGLPAGQLQRIADAVLASVTGKPEANSPNSAPGANNPSSPPLAEGSVRTLVIKLDPPDYGTLTIRIKLTGKTMAVQFHAARSETARLLSNDRDKLSAAMESDGHDLDISIVGAAPSPALPSSSADQSWLPGSAGGSPGSQLANPEGERRPAPPPTHPFGDDRQFPDKNRNRDSHEPKPQDRRSGALYV